MIRFFRELSVIQTSSNLLFYEPLITTFCNQLFTFCSLIKVKNSIANCLFLYFQLVFGIVFVVHFPVLSEALTC